jgi:hypothetical protein
MPTLIQLENNTKLLHPHSYDRGKNSRLLTVNDFKLNNFIGMKSKLCSSVVKGEKTLSYTTILNFIKIEDFDKALDLDSNLVQCYCSCEDYYFTWWYYNRKDNCHYGRPLREYVRKTKTYPERNRLHIPGMCKHCMALANHIKKEKLI